MQFSPYFLVDMQHTRRADFQCPAVPETHRWAIFYSKNPRQEDHDGNIVNMWGAICMASGPNKASLEVILAALRAYKGLCDEARKGLTPEEMRDAIRDLNSRDLTSGRSQMLAVGKPEKQ